MKKLWQKNKANLHPVVEAFETKGDLICDQKLLIYDVQGSIAHAKMLAYIGMLTKEEYKILEKGLHEILELDKKGTFQLVFGDEDIHTKIENYLTEKYGEAGKKIHTARSRNDQVLTALRLYNKENLKNVELETMKLKNAFKQFSNKYKNIPMPGYTHMQKAMPSSLSLWAESFVDSLLDDIQQVQSVYKLIDQSPLGSAAGYGMPIQIDRQYSANVLRFSRVQENSLYCQNSRGKFDTAILSALLQVQMTINKFATDVLLFTTSEFNFFLVSDILCSGSSIMPQKKNIDVAELLRSKIHVVLGHFIQSVSLSSNLISGYNRDLQDNKKAIIESFEITIDTLKISSLLINNLKPNEEVLNESMTKELYTAEKALKMSIEGKPFRDAYAEVAKEFK